MKYKILTNFSMTNKAKSRIDEIKSENENIFIRVMITDGGCGGKQYHILMDDYIGETDFVLIKKNKKKKDSIYIVIDKSSIKYLKNSKIDFVNNLTFSGFKIKNPNAKSICNCGNSFSCSRKKIAKNNNCKN